MEAPEYFQTDFRSQLLNESRHSDTKTAGCNDSFIVEELLDFSNDEVALLDANGSIDCPNVSSTDSSTVSLLDTSNSSSFSGCEPASFPGDFAADVQFSSDFCVAYDDLAELEWLSNFAEESFSSEDLQKLQLISGVKAVQPDDTGRKLPVFHSDVSVPAKARSKRSRAAPCTWTSSLPSLSPMSSSSETDIVAPVPPNPAKKARRESPNGKPFRNRASERTGEGRKCLHCNSDQTPQWRTGPMGPKTLCNACGVRFKSGRLVPEYRPAASPTFVLTKHSNSHRKVMELRRQKEITRAHQNHSFYDQNMLFDVSNNEDNSIKQHAGADSVISSRVAFQVGRNY